MKKLVIYGTGLIAELAEFYFRTDTAYQVAAFTNAGDFVKEEHFRGMSVVPFEELERTHPPFDYDLFIAIGYAKTNTIRQSRFQEAKRRGYTCATYMSTRATHFDPPIGENCLILEQNVLQPFVTIGHNVTLWSGNHIGHHTQIGNHCFISSHVVVSGGCSIDENCFLGVNSSLRDNTKLGKFVVVGSGAVVLQHCEDHTVVQAAESAYRVIRRHVI